VEILIEHVYGHLVGDIWFISVCQKKKNTGKFTYIYSIGTLSEQTWRLQASILEVDITVYEIQVFFFPNECMYFLYVIFWMILNTFMWYKFKC